MTALSFNFPLYVIFILYLVNVKIDLVFHINRGGGGGKYPYSENAKQHVICNKPIQVSDIVTIAMSHEMFVSMKCYLSK